MAYEKQFREHEPSPEDERDDQQERIINRLTKENVELKKIINALAAVLAPYLKAEKTLSKGPDWVEL